MVNFPGWEWEVFYLFYLVSSSGSTLEDGAIKPFTIGILELCFLEGLWGWVVNTCLGFELLHQEF